MCVLCVCITEQEKRKKLFSVQWKIKSVRFITFMFFYPSWAILKWNNNKKKNNFVQNIFEYYKYVAWVSKVNVCLKKTLKKQYYFSLSQVYMFVVSKIYKQIHFKYKLLYFFYTTYMMVLSIEFRMNQKKKKRWTRKKKIIFFPNWRRLFFLLLKPVGYCWRRHTLYTRDIRMCQQQRQQQQQQQK